MDRKYKVYSKDEKNRLHTALVTKDYKEACKKESELNDNGIDAFVWEC